MLGLVGFYLVMAALFVGVAFAWLTPKQRAVVALVAALPLAAQQPRSFHGSSNSWAPWETDKKLHVLWGAMIGASAYCLAERLGYKYPVLHALFWAALAGYLKERYDGHHGGRGEWADMGNTALGGVLVSLPIRLSAPSKPEFATAPKAIP